MLRLMLMLPFLIVLVAFVFYNQNPEAIDLLSFSRQSSVGVVALVSAAVFFLLGALLVWFSELKQRRRARRAEQQVRALEIQLTELRAQVGQVVAQHGTYVAGAHPAPLGAAPIVP